MCQLTVKTELEQLRFAVSALASSCGEKGSHERENAANAARGIRARLDWCIQTIDKEPELIGAPKRAGGW